MAHHPLTKNPMMKKDKNRLKEKARMKKNTSNEEAKEAPFKVAEKEGNAPKSDHPSLSKEQAIIELSKHSISPHGILIN